MDTNEEYDRGFADGRASRDAEFSGLQHLTDYWYFRANNPGVKTADEKVIDSIIAGMESRERQMKVRNRLDAVEEQMFSEARRLIKESDLDDVQIAVKVGLFAPTVAHIREALGTGLVQ